MFISRNDYLNNTLVSLPSNVKTVWKIQYSLHYAILLTILRSLVIVDVIKKKKATKQFLASCYLGGLFMVTHGCFYL